MNVGSLFQRHATYRAEKTAFVFGKTRLTYRELNQHVNRIANVFTNLGIKKGDKIATLLPNCQELYEIFWACGKIGAVVVPLSTMLQPNGLKNLLQDSDSKALITAGEVVQVIQTIQKDVNIISDGRILVTGDWANETEAFRSYQRLKENSSQKEPEAEEVVPEDPFNIIYSSGTTGLPKGIVHTNYIRCMYGLCFSSVFRIMPESVTYHAGAIVFNGAFVDLMPTVLQGATYVLSPKFDPIEFIETVATERVTHVSMVPSQLISLLYSPNFSPEKLKSLEMILVMGAPLHQRHKEELDKHLPGRFYELYGNTEGVITVLDKTDFKAKPNSVGAPTPFFNIKILDEENNEVPAGTMGEICGTSPLHMKGYYKRPDLTSQTVIDGLIHTGDMGYLDEDGYLYLVDRKKDMIVSGGVNVYPRDIEEVAIKHPAIQEVAVFGVQDEKWGETPVAGVTLSQGENVSPPELKEWINERVGAKYQRISSVIILKDFPRNVAGKVLKRELRETCQEVDE